VQLSHAVLGEPAKAQTLRHAYGAYSVLPTSLSFLEDYVSKFGFDALWSKAAAGASDSLINRVLMTVAAFE